MSATKIGINFRGTSGYVTDGTDQTYCVNDQYPTTRASWTFGWAGATAPSDRNAGNDPRLAGINFDVGTTQSFRVDLPAAGNYNVRLAIGDAASAQFNITVLIKDGASTLLTVGPVDPNMNAFYDAAGVSYTAANWPGSNTSAALTFAGSVLTMTTSSPNAWTIAHLEIEQVGGGPVFIAPRPLVLSAAVRRASFH